MFRKYRAWLKDVLHHRSQYTMLCWTSALALLINAVILIAAFFTLNEKWCVKYLKIYFLLMEKHNLYINIIYLYIYIYIYLYRY